MKNLAEIIPAFLAKIVDGVSSVSDGRVVTSAQEFESLNKISEMFSQAFASSSQAVGNLTQLSKADALTAATSIFTGISMAPWDTGQFKIAVTCILSSLGYFTDTITHKDKVEKFAKFQEEIIATLDSLSDIISEIHVYTTPWSAAEKIKGDDLHANGGLQALWQKYPRVDILLKTPQSNNSSVISVPFEPICLYNAAHFLSGYKFMSN